MHDLSLNETSKDRNKLGQPATATARERAQRFQVRVLVHSPPAPAEQADAPKASTRAQSTAHQAAAGAQDKAQHPAHQSSRISLAAARAKTETSWASQPRQLHENGRKGSRFESWFTHHELPP
eukprot:SAG11_NODE_9619_length_895_cov_2.218593_1_plen_122_part_10